MTASTRKILTTTSAFALAASVVAPASGATVAAPAERPSVVQLASRPAPIQADGTVAVVMWVRCQPDVYAFEIDTSVVQRNASGSSTLLRGTDAMPGCDGTRQRTVVRVAPDPGDRFHPGVAGIGVYVGFYDPELDRDLEATDEVRVRLRLAG